MYFPDRGCVHTLLALYVYATGLNYYNSVVSGHPDCHHMRVISMGKGKR